MQYTWTPKAPKVSRWARLIGWWRMRRGLCPLCNDDAPAMQDCAVCGRGHVDLPKGVLQSRWQNYVQGQRQLPADLRCPWCRLYPYDSPGSVTSNGGWVHQCHACGCRFVWKNYWESAVVVAGKETKCPIRN